MLVPMLVVLLDLLGHAIAPPPLNTATSLTLSSTNLTSSFLHNMTLGTDVFPPEEDLPHDNVFFYDIPNTDLNLKFRDWYRTDIPQIDALLVLQTATYDCHGFHTPPFMEWDHQYKWEWICTVLDMTPEKGNPDQLKRLTWELWAHAITAIQGWVTAYPDLYVGFEIYDYGIDEEGERAEWYLGRGRLESKMEKRI